MRLLLHSGICYPWDMFHIMRLPMKLVSLMKTRYLVLPRVRVLVSSCPRVTSDWFFWFVFNCFTANLGFFTTEGANCSRKTFDSVSKSHVSQFRTSEPQKKAVKNLFTVPKKDCLKKVKERVGFQTSTIDWVFLNVLAPAKTNPLASHVIVTNPLNLNLKPTIMMRKIKTL